MANKSSERKLCGKDISPDGHEQGARDSVTQTEVG
jgi:hypothetical protein